LRNQKIQAQPLSHIIKEEEKEQLLKAIYEEYGDEVACQLASSIWDN